MAIYESDNTEIFSQIIGAEGFNIEYFNDEEVLKQAVLDGDYHVGITLPDNLPAIWQSGGIADIKVYYSSSTATEIKDAIVALISELAYIQTGQSINYNISQEVLGPDMAGARYL